LKAGQDATELFGLAGIKLEPTYTAKTAAAVLQQCTAHPEQSVRQKDLLAAGAETNPLAK
jgi:hypothetical protein